MKEGIYDSAERTLVISETCVLSANTRRLRFREIIRAENEREREQVPFHLYMRGRSFYCGARACVRKFMKSPGAQKLW